MEKKYINAVYDNDLGQFLKNIGILGRIQAGKMNCYFCKIEIAEDNLSAVLPHENNIYAICDKPECTKALTRHINENG